MTEFANRLLDVKDSITASESEKSVFKKPTRSGVENRAARLVTKAESGKMTAEDLRRWLRLSAKLDRLEAKKIEHAFRTQGEMPMLPGEDFVNQDVMYGRQMRADEARSALTILNAASINGSTLFIPDEKRIAAADTVAVILFKASAGMQWMDDKPRDNLAKLFRIK